VKYVITPSAGAEEKGGALLLAGKACACVCVKEAQHSNLMLDSAPLDMPSFVHLEGVGVLLECVKVLLEGMKVLLLIYVR
jgi:hypothetical protein